MCENVLVYGYPISIIVCIVFFSVALYFKSKDIKAKDKKLDDTMSLTHHIQGGDWSKANMMGIAREILERNNSSTHSAAYMSAFAATISAVTAGFVFVSILCI